MGEIELKKEIIKITHFPAIESRMYDIVETANSLKEAEQVIGKEKVILEIFNEKDVPLETLYEEYENFIKGKKSEMFAYMYILNKKYGVVLDSHIYIYRYCADLFAQQEEIIPWKYTESKKYMGDTWWYEDEEILYDIQHMSIPDFLEKYKGC